MVDAEEILEIVKEIRVELPDEIQQAQWIKDERQRILDEAKREYETVIRDAQKQAEALIENDDITVKAKRRAEEIMNIAESNCKQLKMSTFDYVDSILYNFQDKMEQDKEADLTNENRTLFDDFKAQTGKEIISLVPTLYKSCLLYTS